MSDISSKQNKSGNGCLFWGAIGCGGLLLLSLFGPILGIIGAIVMPALVDTSSSSSGPITVTTTSTSTLPIVSTVTTSSSTTLPTPEEEFEMISMDNMIEIHIPANSTSLTTEQVRAEFEQFVQTCDTLLKATSVGVIVKQESTDTSHVLTLVGKEMAALEQIVESLVADNPIARGGRLIYGPKEEGPEALPRKERSLD